WRLSAHDDRLSVTRPERRRRGRGRQRQPERRAAARDALDADPPAMELDKLLDDGQAQPAAAVRKLGRLGATVERLPDPLDLLWSEPGTGVRHLDPGFGTVQPCPNRDRAF